MTSPLRTERVNLQISISRTAGLLRQMRGQWLRDGSLCCPGCRYGSTWSDTERRLRRQVDRMNWIDDKLERYVVPIGPLRRPANPEDLY